MPLGFTDQQTVHGGAASCGINCSRGPRGPLPGTHRKKREGGGGGGYLLSYKMDES